jgi:hypothetical protein
MMFIRGLACFMIKHFLYIILNLTKSGIANVLQPGVSEANVKVANVRMVSIKGSCRASLLDEKTWRRGCCGYTGA